MALYYLGGVEYKPSVLKTRPFGYPLFLAIFQLQEWKIFYVQFFLTCLQPVILFEILKRFTKNQFFLALGIVLFFLNVSNLLMSSYALTETLVTTLLLFWFYFTQKRDFSFAIFLMAFLSCVKPVFFVLYVIQFIFYFIQMHKKISCKKIFQVVLASIPVIYQIGFMYYNFKILSISIIGQETFKNYFLTMYLMEMTRSSYEIARSFVQSHESLAVSYAFSDLYGLVLLFLRNIWNNIFTHAFTSFFPPRIELYSYSLKFYKFYGIILLFLIFFPILSFRPKKISFNKIIKSEIFMLRLVIIWIVFSSGITYWQADRILLPIYPLVIILTLYSTVRVRIPKSFYNFLISLLLHITSKIHLHIYLVKLLFQNEN